MTRRWDRVTSKSIYTPNGHISPYRHPNSRPKLFRVKTAWVRAIQKTTCLSKHLPFSHRPNRRNWRSSITARSPTKLSKYEGRTAWWTKGFGCSSTKCASNKMIWMRIETSSSKTCRLREEWYKRGGTFRCRQCQWDRIDTSSRVVTTVLRPGSSHFINTRRAARTLLYSWSHCVLIVARFTCLWIWATETYFRCKICQIWT